MKITLKHKNQPLRNVVISNDVNGEQADGRFVRLLVEWVFADVWLGVARKFVELQDLPIPNNVIAVDVLLKHQQITLQTVFKMAVSSVMATRITAT